MIRNRNKNKIYSAGFTLVELLVVIVIIGVLTGIAIPTFSKLIDKAQAAACKSNRRDFLAGYKMDYTLNGSHADGMTTITAALSKLDISGTQVFGSGNLFSITGLCRNNGTVTAKCGEHGDIALTCSEHPDSPDTTGVASQADSFITAANKWISANGTMKDKGDFYADYYSSHSAVKMTDQYRNKLIESGLNNKITAPLYWWTYPVTDGYGNLRYMVTYANTQSNTANWTSGARGSMNKGYVVIVNGKTYIRTNSGNTVEPGNIVNKFQTEDALESELIKNGYKVVS